MQGCPGVPGQLLVALQVGFPDPYLGVSRSHTQALCVTYRGGSWWELGSEVEGTFGSQVLGVGWSQLLTSMTSSACLVLPVLICLSADAVATAIGLPVSLVRPVAYGRKKQSWLSSAGNVPLGSVAS